MTDQPHPQDHTDDVLRQLGSDPELDVLTPALARLRRDSTASVTPDERLETLFDQEPVPSERRVSPPPSWWRRPVWAFAAAFLMVLAVGGGAFALVSLGGGGVETAQPGDPTTTAAAALSSQTTTTTGVAIDEEAVTAYVGCALDLVGGWLMGGFDGETPQNAPLITEECGALPLPDLGPGTEAFGTALGEWLDCTTAHLNETLPEAFGSDGSLEELTDLDPTIACGEPPQPEDFGLDLGGFELEGLGDLGHLELEEIVPQEFLDRIADGQFFLEDLDGFQFEEFDGEIPPELRERLDEFLGQLPDDATLEQYVDEFMSGFPDNLDGLLPHLGNDVDLEALEERIQEQLEQNPDLDLCVVWGDTKIGTCADS